MILLSKEYSFLNTMAGGKNPFYLIAGPCVAENNELLEKVASELVRIKTKYGIPVIFKSSFDKANRSSIHSYRGPGLDDGLQMLSKIKADFDLPILTDVHLPEHCNAAAQVADILQIPAFLSRQTDLLLAAAKTKKWVNVKKGQFMAPMDASNIIEKFREVGSEKVSICERGYTFGYNNLVVDMRGISQMQEKGFRVVFDATHSTQLPGGGLSSGGQREMAYPLARAAVAVGIDGIFMEVHPNPEKAKSDATNQLELNNLESVIASLLAIDAVVKGRK